MIEFSPEFLNSYPFYESLDRAMYIEGAKIDQNYIDKVLCTTYDLSDPQPLPTNSQYGKSPFKLKDIIEIVDSLLEGIPQEHRWHNDTKIDITYEQWRNLINNTWIKGTKKQ